MKAKSTSTFIEIVWRLLLLLFLYTALDKIHDFPDFIMKMNGQPFNDKFTPFLVYAVPGGELLVCILLFFRRTRFYGFLSSAILMLVFTLYVGLVTFHFFKHIPCSCSAIHRKLSWPQHLLINTIFLVLAVSCTWLTRKLRHRREEESPPHLSQSVFSR